MERVTDVVAAAGIASAFMPGLYAWTASISQFAALMMPILGCGWLAVQIWSRLTDPGEHKQDEGDGIDP